MTHADSALLPLSLAVNPAAVMTEADHKTLWRDKHYLRILPDLLERDLHTCRFCGVQVPPGFSVSGGLLPVFLDGQPTHLQADNLASACPLCHQVHHIGLAADRRSGVFALGYHVDHRVLNRLSALFWFAPLVGSGEPEIARIAQDWEHWLRQGRTTLEQKFPWWASLETVASALREAFSTDDHPFIERVRFELRSMVLVPDLRCRHFEAFFTQCSRVYRQRWTASEVKREFFSGKQLWEAG